MPLQTIPGRLARVQLSRDGVEWLNFGGIVDVTMSVSISELETTTHDSAGRRSYIPNFAEYSMRVDARHIDEDPGQWLAHETVDTLQPIQFRYLVTGRPSRRAWQGMCFLRSGRLKGPLDDVAGFDIEMRCTRVSAYRTDPVPPDPVVDPYPLITSGLMFRIDAGVASSYPGTGSNWTDLVAGRVVSLVNGPTYQATEGALRFNGSNQRGQCTTIPAPNTAVTDASGAAMFTVTRPRAATDGWPAAWSSHTVGHQTNSSQLFITWNTPLQILGASGMTTNNWHTLGHSIWPTPPAPHHVTYPTGQRHRLIKNGTLGAVGNASPMAGAQTRLDVGCLGPSPSFFFNGDIAVLLIYSRFLTDAEHKQLHNHFASSGRFGMTVVP